MASATDVAGVVAVTPRPDRPVLVAVDGVDGSGKTTFAGQLAAAYEASGRPTVVVHLDDFLNPRAVRYRLGRDSPEGFVRDTYDLDAFQASVLRPLGSAGDRRIRLKTFDYGRDVAVDDRPVPIAADAVVIVEGMFLHRDELHGVWDVSVFLDVPFSLSVLRMANRDGSSADPDDPSLRRYVEGQRLYLSRCSPRFRATCVIDNS